MNDLIGLLNIEIIILGLECINKFMKFNFQRTIIFITYIVSIRHFILFLKSNLNEFTLPLSAYCCNRYIL